MPDLFNPASVEQCTPRQRDPKSLNDFPTPPWALRALIEWGWPIDLLLAGKRILECAANRGYLAETLREYSPHILTSDIADYGVGYRVMDFMSNEAWEFYHRPENRPDLIITNPPYSILLEFMLRAIHIAKEGVAFFCRSAVAEGQKRYKELFQAYPGQFYFAQFVERCSTFEAAVDPNGSKPQSNGWLIFRKDANHRIEGLETRGLAIPKVFIPPCRKLMERPGDYDQRGVKDTPVFINP